MDADEVEVASSQYNYESEEDIEVECEQEVSSVPWSELPAPAIEYVYSFLGRKDQSSMSQVCKNWSREYSSPNLWRNIKFRLPEHAYTVDILPEVRFAQKYAHFFHHVWIICGRSIPYGLIEDIRRQLHFFLQCLEHHSQLLSISFEHLKIFLAFLCEADISAFQQSLISLLLTQNQLQSVVIKEAYFTRSEGIEIIEAIFLKSSKTLEKIHLETFMIDNVMSVEDFWPNITINVPLTFEALMNLKSLTISYTTYFENIIKSCYEYGSRLSLQKTGALESVVLICKGNDYDVRNCSRIDSEAWKYFRVIFPTCRVAVHIEDENQVINGFNLVIVRHMPVRCLDLRCDLVELGSILRHLTECDINGELESLSISGLGNTNLAQDLLNFLQVSPKLRWLQFYFDGEVNELSTVFDYWLENGLMSLEIVHITIRNVRNIAAASNHTILSDTYVPQLKAVGLDLIFIVDI